MLPHFSETWGNPSSLHSPGQHARRAVDEARRSVARCLACAAEEVVFTGSGTEAANLAIKGVALAASPNRRRVVTSRVEHHAVLDTCHWLQEARGFEIVYVDVDREGTVDLEQLERAVDERTALVSIMYANNEVGTIQPVEQIARIAHARGAPVHTDAVQAAGSLSIDVDRLGVDLLSISAHKFYGPKGIGALYVRRGTRLQPQVHGGGQERGRRSGTENVPSIVGMARALELAQEERERSTERLRPMAARLLHELPQAVPGCRVTGHPHQRLAYHASFAFDEVEIAPILLGLDRLGIWASSGSACTSASSEPSHVLAAMGVPRSALFGALRVTFGRENVPGDVDRLLEVIPPLMARARGTPADTSRQEALA